MTLKHQNCVEPLSGSKSSNFLKQFKVFYISKKFLKLKNYPNLTVDASHTIVHEIGHALGLEHFSSGSLSQYTKFNIDPYDVRINNRSTTMSYNNFMYADEENFFTELDIKALRHVWGVEKNN